VYLACGYTDMRKGMATLAMLVQQTLDHDPFSGAVYAFRGRRGKLATFYIQFASVDDCLSVASVVWADTASLSTSARQRSDVHLHGRVPRPEPGIADLDVRSSLLRGHDARYASDQSGRPY
jgi:transposase